MNNLSKHISSGGFTHKAFAYELGISEKEIKDIIHRRISPSIKTITNACLLLGVNRSILFGNIKATEECKDDKN